MMLGNVAPLWECMLAAMKLGAVVIPATTLLTRDDLLDRFARGRVRHVVAGADSAGKFADLPGDYTRIAVGGSAPGWASWEAGYDAPAEFVPHGETRATDPLLLYFTSGTTAKPKLVLHSHQSYPVGHLSTMYYLGVKPGDIHLNISSPGWAKHAYSCVFAPWNAGATVFMLNQPRFNAKGLLDALARCGVTTFCAPPTVWRMLIQEDLKAWNVSLREALGAGEPLNPEIIEQVQRCLGRHGARRLWPDRDDVADRQFSRAKGQARVDGPSRAGLPCATGRRRWRRATRSRGVPGARSAAAWG